MKSTLREIIEWLICIIIAVVLALLVRYYIGTPTIVQQTSMTPTLKENERLWLNRWVRTIKEMPKRGDIITFEAPSKLYSGNDLEGKEPIATYTNEPTNPIKKFLYYVVEMGKDSYIKRVIALPGDHVQIKDGNVYVNEEKLNEEYLAAGVTTSAKVEGLDDFTVPENCVFAMGDNRGHSTDCREFGCIPLEKIESKVAIRIWPLNLWGKVK